ncbi:MAG: hypothetical protein WAV15_02740 [Minisyncoccia bacterium]
MKIFSLKNNKNKVGTCLPKLHGERGFMLIEVLVAVSIITAAVLATMTVAQKSIYISRQALHATQAGFLLEEGAEVVRITRDNAWTNISLLTLDTDYYPIFVGGAWTLSLTPNTVGEFTRVIRFSAVTRDDTTKNISGTGTNDPQTKLVVVTVSWVEGGVTITKILPFYIADIFFKPV